MEISILIPSYNRKEYLLKCITSLLSWKSKSFEVVVCIDGSKDETMQAMNHFEDRRLKVIYQDNKGRSGARNAAVMASSGNYLWFLDDDMKSDAAVLKLIHDHFLAQPDSILVGGQFERPERCKTDVQKYKYTMSLAWQEQLGHGKTILDRPYITAANFAVPRTVFEKIGGFDERLRDVEDYDFALRAFSLEIPIYFDRKMVGWHEPVKSAREYVYRLREYNQALKLLGELKPDQPIMEVYRPGLMKRFVFSLLRSPRWIQRMDAEKLSWIPKSLRYRLYSAILTSQSRAD